MEFIFILFSHLLGDYIFKPKWVSENKSKKPIALIVHLFIYSMTLYLAFPFIILILQIFSGMPMIEFLSTYELTSLNKWNFDVFLFIFGGHLLVDVWTHRLSYFFNNRYIDTLDWKWKYFSKSIIGIDQFLHIVHLYIIYNIIFV